MKRYVKSICFVLIYMLIFIIIRSLCLSLFNIIEFVRLTHESMDILDYESLGRHIIINIERKTNLLIIFSNLLSFIVFVLIFKIRNINLINLCNFSFSEFRYIGLVNIIAILLYIFWTCFLSITTIYKLSTNYVKEAILTVEGESLLIVIFSVGIIGPVLEEVLFRGMIFNELKKIFSLLFAVILQGLMFGVWHGEILSGIIALLMGCLFALFYEWFKTIWIPISMHVFYNCSSIFCSKFDIHHFIKGYEIYIMISIGLIIFSLILLIWNKVGKLRIKFI